MANMSKNGTTGKYELNITPSTSAQTKTLKVGGNYCDADIDVNVDAIPGSYIVPSGYIILTENPNSGTDVTEYAIAKIQNGSATTPTNTTALSSSNTSLSGITLTVQASVTPTVSPGWVSSGTAGTVKISGTVPTETKAVKSTTSVQSITPTTGKLISSITVSPVSVRSRTVTPSASEQTITPGTGYDYLSSVVVNTDENLIAANIKKDVTIFGVTGSLVDYALYDDPNVPNATSAEIRTDYEAYTPSGTKIVGTMPDVTYSTGSSAASGSTTKATITPTTSDQYVNISAGYNEKSNVKINALSNASYSLDASAASGSTNEFGVGVSTSDQYINITEGYTTKKNIKINKINNASGFALSIDDLPNLTLTVGTLSDGWYPFTTDLSGSVAPSTQGLITTSGTGTLTANDVVVGRLAAAHPVYSVSSYTAPSVAVSGSASGFTASSSATSYYVTVNASASNGSVKAKYQNITAGYQPLEAGVESEATTITPTVSGSGNKVYIPAGSMTANSNNGSTKYLDVTPGSFPYYANVNAGYFPTGRIKINAPSNLSAGNIKSGVTIAGVTGTYTGVTPSVKGFTSNWPNYDDYAHWSNNVTIGKNQIAIFGTEGSSSYCSNTQNYSIRENNSSGTLLRGSSERTGFFVFFSTERNKWVVNTGNYVNGGMEYTATYELNTSAEQLYLSTSGYSHHWTVLTVSL